MISSKERILNLKSRLSSISERRKEHIEEERLKKQVEKEEKRYIKEERYRLKHPTRYKVKKVISKGAIKLLHAYKETQKRQKRKSKKLRM